MHGKVRLVEGMRFVASTGVHSVVMDSSEEGSAAGPSPMETVMLAAGCCTAMDVVHILRKMRQEPEDLEVRLEAERASEDPKVFAKLRVHYAAAGQDLKEEAVKRAVSLSLERYCSVLIMLQRAGVEVSSSVEVRRSL